MSSQSSNRVVLFTALAWGAGLFVVGFALRLAIDAINKATNYSIDPFMGGFFHTLLIAPALAGAFAAYWTVRLIRRHAGIGAMRPVPVMLVWAVVMVFGALFPFYYEVLINSLRGPLEPDFYSAINALTFFRFFVRDFFILLVPAALGGLVLAKEARRAGLRLSGREMLLVAAGWGVGFGLGAGLSSVALNLYTLATSLSGPGWFVMEMMIWLRYGVMGLIGGAVGAWATLRVTRLHARAPEPGLQSAQAHSA